MELAIAGVENSRADVAASIVDYMKSLISALEEIYNRYPDAKVKKDVLLLCLSETVDAVAGFARLCDVISRHESKTGVASVASGFSGILSRYHPSRTATSYHDSDFDFYKILGHELFVTLIAILLQRDQFDLIKSVFATQVFVEGLHGSELKDWRAVSECPDMISIAPDTNGATRGFVWADYLKGRHSSGDIAKYCTYGNFISADYFLYLASFLRVDSQDGPSWFVCWMPVSVIHMTSGPPQFMVKAKSIVYLNRLMELMNIPDVRLFRERYSTRGISAIISLFLPWAPLFAFNIGKVDPNQIGTDSAGLMTPPTGGFPGR